MEPSPTPWLAVGMRVVLGEVEDEVVEVEVRSRANDGVVVGPRQDMCPHRMRPQHELAMGGIDDRAGLPPVDADASLILDLVSLLGDDECVKMSQLHRIDRRGARDMKSR